MTGNKDKFISLKIMNGGQVTFDDNTKGKVGSMPHCFIDNDLLVKGLKRNLLSISQFCDKGNQVIFKSN